MIIRFIGLYDNKIHRQKLHITHTVLITLSLVVLQRHLKQEQYSTKDLVLQGKIKLSITIIQVSIKDF